MRRVTLVLGIVILSGCMATTNTSSDFHSGDAEAVIRAMNKDVGAAVARGNVDDTISAYADDAVLMPPNAPVMTGRDAIRQFWEGHIASGKMDLALTTDHVLQSGDLAAERGRYELTITPPGGSAIHDSGKYVVVWQKQNGKWRIVEDIFNSSMAAH